MRVFYPISARFSDLVNNQGEAPSAWMMLWSGFSIALLILVFSSLPSFEGGAAVKQHEYFSSTHFKHAVHNTDGHTYKNTPVNSVSVKTPLSTQDYIDAHRCAQQMSCLASVKASQLPAAPTVLKAGGGLYL
jgi:hypothetical protein